MLKNKLFFISIISVIAFLIYSNSINSSFHLDDYVNFADNPDTMLTELSFSSLKRAALTDVTPFRPIPYLTFSLNYYVSGKDTTSYHVVNIVIHIINTFLVYLVILSLFGYDNAENEKRKRLHFCAFFTALFWLVTPVNSQAVVYIVQRMTLIMTLFFLLAFLTYISARKKKSVPLYILCAVFFVLSFLSKQNALIFPLIVVLYELVFVKKGEVKNISCTEKVTLITLLIVLFLPLVIFRSHIHEQFLIGVRNWGFTYYERELSQFRVLVSYLSLLILPLPGRLSITHDVIKSTSLFTPVTTIFSIIFVTALLIVSILRIKRSPYFSFAFLWFFVTMSVEALFPVEMMYEHRLYLPSIFLFGTAVGYLTNRFYGKNRRALMMAFSAVIIIYSSLTAIRGLAWESELTLWQDTVKKYPDDPRANTNLGTAYNNSLVFDKAERYLELGINKWLERMPDKDLSKDLAIAYNNLGNAKINQGKKEPAIKSYLRAIEFSRHWHMPYLNLGIAYLKMDEYEKSVANLKKAVKYSPDNYECHINLGGAYYMLQDYDNALVSYKKAIKLNPDELSAYKGLVAIFQMKGDYDKAEKTLINLLSILPERNNPQEERWILSNLGYTYLKKKEYKKSIDLYQKFFAYGIKEDSDHADALFNLGSAYASSGDYERAIDSFKKSIYIALKIKAPYYNFAKAYNDLGNTYKLTGNYEKASISFKKALEHFPENKMVLEDLKSVKKELMREKSGK